MSDAHPPRHPSASSTGGRLNWLRAAVLGANDGVVSTAGLVVGVAGATDRRGTLLTAGLAGLLAGSISMAAGEYVSVCTQRDAQRAALELEKRELRAHPEEGLDALEEELERRGLSPSVADAAARELSAKDAWRAHARVELGIDPDELTDPWRAAAASFCAFTAGALLPLLMIVLLPAGGRLPVTIASVLATLALTGWTGARLGASPVRPSVLRNVLGGALAMGVTYAVGSLLASVV
ncbi:VIT family protein [Streptomyces luteireticuli]|uniref:VIT family protein n=1 Tax=Streptomyces luteireticuli TaxID=173858 RepID=A0ABP3IST4_9ACTN